MSSSAPSAGTSLQSNPTTSRVPPVAVPNQTTSGPSSSNTLASIRASSSSVPSAGSSRPSPAENAASGTGSGRTTGPPVVRNTGRNAITVNTRQKGNPLLDHVRNVAWEYGDKVVDYEVGATSGVLYLSLRYHRLHPEYIHTRIQQLGQGYHLRILLLMCDAEDHQDGVRELTKVALVNNLTLMVAWSHAEAARYLEIYKQFERKPPDLIKERIDDDYMSRLNAALTSVRGVNKTDVVTLSANFGSVKNIVEADSNSLLLCPGLGEKKVKRLRDAFTAPFLVRSGSGAKRMKKSEAEKRSEVGHELN